MRVIPVNFQTEHKQMISHLYLMVNKEYLAIPNQEKYDYDKLIVSLTAQTNEFSGLRTNKL